MTNSPHRMRSLRLGVLIIGIDIDNLLHGGGSPRSPRSPRIFSRGLVEFGPLSLSLEGVLHVYSPLLYVWTTSSLVHIILDYIFFIRIIPYNTDKIRIILFGIILC